MKKYHYFYKITNNINNHFYFGVHNTDNLNDGYMGSGTRLKCAYQKYGIENFSKEIIKFFDTAEDAFLYESEIVNEELVLRDDCYNIQMGGKTFNTSNFITVKNKNSENYFLIHKEKYIADKDKYDTPWTGKHHKKTTRDNVRKTMSNKTTKGKRTWVNKNGIVKYILNEKLDIFLQDGWELGRIGYKPRKNCQGKVLQ